MGTEHRRKNKSGKKRFKKKGPWSRGRLGGNDGRKRGGRDICQSVRVQRVNRGSLQIRKNQNKGSESMSVPFLGKKNGRETCGRREAITGYVPLTELEKIGGRSQGRVMGPSKIER